MFPACFQEQRTGHPTLLVFARTLKFAIGIKVQLILIVSILEKR